MRTREKNIDDVLIASIVGLIDSWNGKLSWDALREAIIRREGRQYTRQALHRHERIRLAFSVRKKAPSTQSEDQAEPELPIELKIATDRITRLEAENQRLRAEVNALLEQFARWAYNAHTRNLSEEFLNKPLPGVDRERSDAIRPHRKKRNSR